MSPVLFLDFDGVLHPKGADPSGYFVHLPRLEAVLRDWPDVRIVLSTSWQDAYSLPALRRRFSADIAARIVGGTRSADPDGEAETRYEEIRMYLRQKCEPGVQWIAVDDAADEFPEGCPQLVQCEHAVGFDDRVALELRQGLMRMA